MESQNLGINLSMFDQFGLKKELIDEASKDPAKLVELFKGVTSEEWHCKAGKTIDDIFKKIEILDSEGKLNENQIKSIIKVSSKIYPKQDREEIKDAFSNFLIKQVDVDKINASNVFSYLKYSQRMNRNESISKCLEFLLKRTGATFKISNSSLSITVGNPQIPLEEISEKITNLSKVFENKIEIAYFPISPNSCPIVGYVKNFIKEQGKSIRSLNLTRLPGKDREDFAKQFIKSCPNLEQFICENNITIESLEELSHLKSLTRLELSWCSGLTALPAKLPESLTYLYLSGCSDLTALPAKLSESLTYLCLSGCSDLTALPAKLPESLTHLDLSDCLGLTALPARLPESLTYLSLSNCHGLTEDIRLSALSSILSNNVEQGLKLIYSFNIVDQNKLFKSIAEGLAGAPLQPDQNPRDALINALQDKLSDQTIQPSTLWVLARYIYDNHNELLLHEEHPLLQEANEIILLANLPEVKNPFNVFEKLKELSLQPSSFKPLAMEIEGVAVAINLAQLQAMARGPAIKREDLPKNVSHTSFMNLVDNLERTVENDPVKANVAFSKLGTTWAEVSTPILNDSSQHLAGMLKLSGEKVSDTEAKWRAVLRSILDKKNDLRPEEFSEREETFILTMMGIQNCRGGKDAGIALTYEVLDPQYRYQVSISKAQSVEEMEARKERLKGIEFIEQFMEHHVEKSLTERAKALADYVNEKDHRRERSAILNTLTRDLVWKEDEHWRIDEENDIDILMNEKGALALLERVDKEAKGKLVNALIGPLIGQAIQKLMVAQFSGTNKLMQDLTGAPEIYQGAHQAIYLKNLIGGLVGVSQGVAFDRHTGTLYEQLLNKGRDEVLELLFSKYMTPESYVNEIVRVVNGFNNENKQLLESFLGHGFWEENAGLNRQGALSLLEQLNFLERAKRL
ncbi:MAG: hypothetical protein H0U49_07475 [Parachlamydiaceae bacterium]|nr:hypothetical protein [Parachlamydiaceae bacterium]